MNDHHHSQDMTSTDHPYEQWIFETGDAAKQEVLMALLADSGFEGFEQRAEGLLAAAPAGTVDSDEARRIAGAQGVDSRMEIIQPRNWNAQWEADYQPVIVPGWCTVRAHFHPPATDTPYEVVITPKMSFGTGHHATTWLMLDALRDVEFSGRDVLDFGTGTGVLAILAARLGARRVLAIDNDAWSVENAAENAAMNDVAQMVEVAAGSLEAAGGESFDIILANINRHVLLEHMAAMHRLVRPRGTVLISGLLVEDEAVITTSARAAGFTTQPVRERTGWIMMRLEA